MTNHNFYDDRGEVINGGFGLVLDGTEEVAERLKMMLSWDVLNGVGLEVITKINTQFHALYNGIFHIKNTWVKKGK